MNSSEQLHSTEGKWAAYVDGKLGAEEAAAFEREHPDAVESKAATVKIQSALQRHSPSPVLWNADFFSEQILQKISPPPRKSRRRAERATLWPLWRLALAGACCLAVTATIYTAFVRGHSARPDRYVANVLSVKAGDDGLDATLLDADGLAVLWIDGLDQLPNDYVLQ